MTNQGELSKTRRTRPVWAFLLFLILAAVSLLLHIEKNRRREDIRKAKEHFASRTDARQLDQIKAERARFYKTQFYLGYPRSVSHAVADLILHLDGIVKPLRLLKVQVDPGLHDLKFELLVGIAAAVPEKARRQFAVFFGKLKNLPGVTQASFSVADRAGAGDGLQVFAISGQAEWQ